MNQTQERVPKQKKLKDPYATTRVAYIGEAGFEYLISLFVSADLLEFILKNFVESAALRGIISSIATFACIAQICALFFAGRRVKRLVTISHVINQSSFVLLYFLPGLPLPSGAKTALFLVFLTLGHLINQAINSTKINWLMQSVPGDIRGRFTAVKEMISLAAGMALSMGLGVFAEHMEAAGNLEAYYLICAAGLIALTLLHTFTLVISKEPPLPEGTRPLKPLAALKQVFAIPAVLRVMMVGVLWNIAVGFSFSYFSAYKQGPLGFSLDQVMLISVIAQGCRLLASPILGKFADRFSFTRSMTLGFGIAAVAFFANIFTAPGSRWLFLAFLCLYYISLAGVNSGFINLVFDFVPPQARQAAMGFQHALSGVLHFAASLVGGLICGVFEENGGGFTLFGLWIHTPQLLSLISGVSLVLIIGYMFLVIFPLQKRREEARGEVQ